MTTYAVFNPASGSLVKTYPTATDAEIEASVASAASAYKNWARSTTVAERAALMRRVAELHEERKEELGATIEREMGKPLADSIGEVDFSAAIYVYYADNAEAFLADEPLDARGRRGSAIIRRSPVGVLLGIMPWNYPYYQVARFAGPNLVLGNTIVLKHAPQCPESAALIQQIFLDAGFPEGAYVNIYATNEQVADIIADPRVQGVSLTGSERAGAAVAEIAGRNLKKVVLELGGSDPFIVLSSDDLDATVDAAMAARFENTGQACNAAKRFIVAADVYDDFVEKFTAKVLAAAASGSPRSRRWLPPSDSRSRSSSAVSTGRQADVRWRAQGRVLPRRGADRRHPRHRRLRRGAVRTGRHRLQGRGRGRGDPSSANDTPLRPGLLRVHHRRRAGASGSPTRSTPAWCSSTASAPRVSSCRSAA